MKKRILNSLTTAFILALTIFISCGGNGGDNGPDPDTPFADRLGELNTTWTLSGMPRVDGAEIEGWDGFQLTLGGTANGDDAVSGTFSAPLTNRPELTEDVWPTSGTWEFTGDVANITRNDGVAIRINSVTETNLQIRFDIADQGGRTDVVAGSWNMEFTTQR